MKYMVMECHPGYAVVLDEQGRFSKVANMHYEVGQTVTDVFELSAPQTQSAAAKKKSVRWLYSLAAAAACLVLIFTSVFFAGQMPYASVYMTINPEVRIDVNRKDIVVGLEGVNADGKALIEGYSYQKKDLDLVVDELVDRAIEMGFLYEGGQITLELDADDNQWIVTHSDSLDAQLNEYLTDKLTVTIEVVDKNSTEVTIPIEDDDSGYGDSDYGQTIPSETTAPTTPPPSDSGYGDSGYDPTEGQSNYGETNPPTAPTASDSGYGDSNYDDGQTDYGDQDATIPPDHAGQSDYGDSDDDSNDDSDDDSSDYE